MFAKGGRLGDAAAGVRRAAASARPSLTRIVAGWLVAACAAGAIAAPADTRFDTNFGGMRLTDQDGRVFSPSGLDGKLVLFNFVYTGCSSTCPVQTRKLVELQQSLTPALRRSVRFVSVSLDPLSDTPSVLKAYALQMGADLVDWSFVTGRPADIERLSDELRLFRVGGRVDATVKRPDDHATALWLVDASGRMVQRYTGNPPDVQRLARELRQLDEMGRDVARAR